MAAIPWRTAFTGHLHNKIVHFPLALGLAAAVILIVAPRWPAYEPAARVLLIVGALAAARRLGVESVGLVFAVREPTAERHLRGARGAPRRWVGRP